MDDFKAHLSLIESAMKRSSVVQFQRMAPEFYQTLESLSDICQATTPSPSHSQKQRFLECHIGAAHKLHLALERLLRQDANAIKDGDLQDLRQKTERLLETLTAEIPVPAASQPATHWFPPRLAAETTPTPTQMEPRGSLHIPTPKEQREQENARDLALITRKLDSMTIQTLKYDDMHFVPGKKKKDYGVLRKGQGAFYDPVPTSEEREATQVIDVERKALEMDLQKNLQRAKQIAEDYQPGHELDKKLYDKIELVKIPMRQFLRITHNIFLEANFTEKEQADERAAGLESLRSTYEVSEQDMEACVKEYLAKLKEGQWYDPAVDVESDSEEY